MTPATLDDLRREIDRIDDELLDLLRARMEIAEGIRERKQRAGLPPLRPGREAQVLRRLVARAGGALTAPFVVRVWREILGAMTRLQGPLSAAVFAPPGREWAWDMARDHMGVAPTVVRAATAEAAIGAVADGRATLAILPGPRAGDDWWQRLAEAGEGRSRVVARLPFVTPADGEARAALALARGPAEPSGDDVTLLALRAASGAGDPRRPLAAAALAVRPGLSEPSGWLLAEAEGFVAEDDPRLAATAEAGTRVVVLGAYARPLTLGDAG